MRDITVAAVGDRSTTRDVAVIRRSFRRSSLWHTFGKPGITMTGGVASTALWIGGVSIVVLPTNDDRAWRRKRRSLRTSAMRGVTMLFRINGRAVWMANPDGNRAILNELILSRARAGAATPVA